MGRRKARRYRKKKFTFNVRKNLGFLFSFLPFVIVLGVFTGVFFHVKEGLYADPGLTVRLLKVYPGGAVSSVLLQKIEKEVVGKNILSVDLKAIAAQIETSPEIKYARVRRSIPQTLEITIDRRRPAAYFQISSKGNYAVAAHDGVILDVLEVKDSSLPHIKAYGASFDFRRGAKIPNKGFEIAVDFLEKYKNHPLAQQEPIHELSIDSLGNVSAIIGSGPELKLGRNPVEKLAMFVKLLPVLNSQGRETIDYIDLQFDQIIVKRKR